ncbi:MAG: ZIP family metal transporter [Bradymonadaceae bacterium]
METSDTSDENRGGLPLVAGGLVALAVATAAAVAADLWKVLGIGWVAFAAMGVGALFGGRSDGGDDVHGAVWGYGLASGAMIASAAVFLVPPAIEFEAATGGAGLAVGVFAGFTTHTLGHHLTHGDWPVDHTVVELTGHAVAAGAVIGLVYATMPQLDVLLGFAIVSHKGPAGFAAARRLHRLDKRTRVLVLPAAGVAVMATAVALVGRSFSASFDAAVFGFAAGMFLHVAMDFLPRCEIGSEIYEVAARQSDAHETLDDLRSHAVASTGAGGAIVLAIWVLLG